MSKDNLSYEEASRIVDEIENGKYGKLSEIKESLKKDGKDDYVIDFIYRMYTRRRIRKRQFSHLIFATEKTSVEKPENYDSSYEGIYKINNKKVYMRINTSYIIDRSVIKILNNDDKVYCEGYYTLKDETTWLFVKNGLYEGYINSDFLTKE